MTASKARGSATKGRSVGAKLQHLLRVFGVPSEQFVREMVSKHGFRPDAVKGWLDDSRNPYEATIERITDYWKIYLPGLDPSWFLAETPQFEKLVAARLDDRNPESRKSSPGVSASLKLTANDIRTGLMRPVVKEAVTNLLAQVVSSNNSINFVAVYQKSGDTWIHDPYNPNWSIKSLEEHLRFYSDIGILARPIMQHYQSMLLGGPGRKGSISEEVGEPEFIVMQMGRNDASVTPRHLAVAPLDSACEFFLVAVAWGRDMAFSYNMFSTEFLHCKYALTGILK